MGVNMRIFQAKAALKIAGLGLMGALFVCGISAVLPAQAPLPRATLANFKYLGAFKAPFGEYGACKIAWNPGGNGGQGSLYLTGGGTDSFSIGEIGIPELVNTQNRDDLALLNMAQVLQAPADIYSRIPQKAASWPVGDVNLYDGGNYAVFGGLYYEEGKLYFNACTYYDGEGTETATSGRIENPSDLAQSSVVGMFHNQGAAHTSGWMMSVPAEWQARLGGTHLTGNDNGIPILSRLSAGPSLFAFNLAAVASAVSSAIIPTVTRMDFPDVSGERSIWGDGMANLSGNNKTWTLMTDAGIGLIIPGTRSYVLLGSAGGFNPNSANPWQGTAEAAFSPPYAGTIAYKRMDSSGYTAGGPMVWDAQDRHYLVTFFDLEEILAAEHPWTPRPYASRIFPAPFGRYGNYDVPGQMPDSIKGGAWDPVLKRLYLTLPAADNANDPEYPGNPVIAVYELLPPGDTDDFLATFDGQGVFYRSSDSGTWTNLATPADLVACGDLTGDGVDDLIGIWSGQAGVWVRSSADGDWAYLGSSPRHIAAGDMNGDGRVDLLGTWDGQGVFYRDSMAGTWSQMATPASLVTTGDLDGDNKSDLIGIWPSQAGVWVKVLEHGELELFGFVSAGFRRGRHERRRPGGSDRDLGRPGGFLPGLDDGELDHDGHPGGPGCGGGFGRRRHGRSDRDLGRAGRSVGEIFGDGELGLYRKLGPGHRRGQNEKRDLGRRLE